MGYSNQQTSCAEIDGARYTYYIDAFGSACIEQCKATCTCLRIPEAIEGFPVTAIADSAFARLSCVEDVICPCALRHIGRHAFEGCLRLQSIQLNDGLRSIGEEAFFLCPALSGLSVPATVEQFGPRPLGTPAMVPYRKASSAKVLLDPEEGNLFFDEDGVLYRRAEDGLVLVDGYRFEGESLACNPLTVEIGPRALSDMATLRRVVLPEGLKRIGDKAFRGSVNLAHVSLPSTLTSIGKAAFSCTALEELNLPARCTQVDDSAFALGPISSDGRILPFCSALRTVGVAEGNEVFCLNEGVLCKRTGDGELEAMLAPAECTRVEFGPTTRLVHDTALAGTCAIGTLHIHDGVRFETERGLVSSCAIRAVEIGFEESTTQGLSLRLPDGGKGRLVLGSGMAQEVFDANAFVQAYDAMLPNVTDGFEQACLVVERLSSPALIGEKAKAAFTAYAESQLAPLCVAVGKRGEHAYYELMADAGLLDEDNIAQITETLSSQGDAESIGYLLEMRQRRFGKASWDDYDL